MSSVSVLAVHPTIYGYHKKKVIKTVSQIVIKYLLFEAQENKN